MAFMKRTKEKVVKGCYFCKNREDLIDYKHDKQMVRYIDERGQIVDRRRTGLCSIHQREMAKAVKRARHIALIPFVRENIK